jgi:hypothetical protein
MKRRYLPSPVRLEEVAMVRRLKRLVGLALVPAFAASAANQPVTGPVAHY